MSVPPPDDEISSVADVSTKEEDYFFTSLGLEDDEDVESGTPTAQSDDLLRSRNRDDRMRAAYEESKRLYKAQHAYTETGWYIGLDRHPHEYTSQVVSGKSGNVRMQTEAAEVDQKMLDANAAYAYYAGDYRKSLSIIVGGSYTSHIPALGSGTTEDETAMKERANKVSREMYDTAMRATVQLEDSGWAGYLADASSKYWKIPGHAGLAESASRAYHTAARYHDAIVALLYAIADRGPLYAYLLAAQETLQAAFSNLQTNTAKKPSPPSSECDTLTRVSEIIIWCIESVPVGYEQPLFPDHTPGPEEVAAPIKKDRPFPARTTGSESYVDLGKDLGIVLHVEGKDLDISRKAWKKLGQMISVRLKVGTQGSEVEDGDPASMGRSVRSL